MPEADLLVRIGADIGDAQAKMQAVQRELTGLADSAVKSESRTSSALGEMKSHWFAVTAAIASAGLVVKKGLDFAREAAEAQENTARLDYQLKSMGVTAAALVPQLQDLARGQLSIAEATALASRGLAQGFSPDQLRSFTQLAKAASSVLGLSVGQAFDQLNDALASGRTGMLKSIGILVDVEEEKKKLEKTTGQLASTITLAQEKQLLLNAVMREAPVAVKRLSDGTDSLADRTTAASKRSEDAWLKAKMALLPYLETVLDFSDYLHSGDLFAGRDADLLKFFPNSEAAARIKAAQAAENAYQLELQLRGKVMVSAAEKTAQAEKEIRELSKAIEKATFDELENAEGSRAFAAGMEVVRKSTEAVTAALDRQAKARQFLADLGKEEAAAQLTRGTPDDAFRRIRQAAFEGTAGTSLEGLKELIGTAKGVTGGDEEDKARLLRDLIASAELRARTDASDEAIKRASTEGGAQAISGLTGGGGGPFGPGSQIITPGGGSTITIPIYIGGELLTTVTRQIDAQQRSDDALVGAP